MPKRTPKSQKEHLETRNHASELNSTIAFKKACPLAEKKACMLKRTPESQKERLETKKRS